MLSLQGFTIWIFFLKFGAVLTFLSIV
jgi:hypothetical protein